MSYNPILFGGYDFTGEINSKPSLDSFFIGKSPCQVFAFEFKTASSFPQVKIDVVLFP